MPVQSTQLDKKNDQAGSTVPLGDQASPANEDSSYLAIILISALSLAALLLVFLPALLKSPPASEESASNEVTTEEAVASEPSNVEPASTASPTSAGTQTPFADAQRQQARTESQTILSGLLSALKQLEELRVDEWAATENASIQSQADSGDEAYQDTAYDEAVANYQQALNEAESLIETGKSKAVEYLELARTDLEDGRVSEAVYNLELAALLDPDLSEAEQLLTRAKVREEILNLISSAEQLQNDGKLEEAKAQYIQAQELDPEFEGIVETINNINNEIADRDYRIAMSQGFSYLSQGNLAAAESAFRNAGEIRPGNPAVTDALQQIDAAKTNNQRQVKLDDAIALEATEEWAGALELYNTLLDQDATLTSAQLGKIRSEARATLNTDIQTILGNPLALQDENKWTSANQVFSEASGIIDRGPKLISQIEQLETVLKQARTKVTVVLSSDNQTNVEIYRLGKIGEFREHAIALFPGRYVVVGTRSGFRDVREELVIDGTKPEVALNIQCVEEI